ncbi:hypothetical protein [Viridibacillus arvi]|uniref:hypothetical protein n=1 Tax=Viridibacillus arvi TaxID=263475 RepID=UPI003D2CB564
MILLENLFLFGYATLYFIFESFSPYYSVFLNIAEENNHEENVHVVDISKEQQSNETALSWSLPSLFLPSEVVKTEAALMSDQVYRVSELKNENHQFFSSILADLNLPTVEENHGYVEIEAQTIKETDDSLLTMDDWNKEMPSFNASLEHSSGITAHISDKLHGLQTWVCTIVGHEENYIHVLDGESRAWVKINDFANEKLSLYDIIELEVERTVNEIIVKNINILKSNDYFEQEVKEDEFYNLDDYAFEETEFYTKTAGV